MWEAWVCSVRREQRYCLLESMACDQRSPNYWDVFQIPFEAFARDYSTGLFGDAASAYKLRRSAP